MTHRFPSFPPKPFWCLFFLAGLVVQLATAQSALPDLTISSVTIQSAKAGAITGSGTTKRRAYDIKYTATIKNIGNAASGKCLFSAGFSKIITNVSFGGDCHPFAPLSVAGTRTVTFTDRIYVPVPLTMPKRDHRNPVQAYFRINTLCGDDTQTGISIEESNTNNNLLQTSVKAIKASN